MSSSHIEWISDSLVSRNALLLSRFLIKQSVCSGQRDYLSSDNVFKSTLWSMIQSPFDSHTHLFFASQNPTLIPPDILPLLNCVVCHRFGSAAWAAHLHSHFVHSAVPLEDYAPKLGLGEALLFAPEGTSLVASDEGPRCWNGGCIRLKVAAVKTREPDAPQEVENPTAISSRSNILASLDAWVAANGTPVLQPNPIPQPQPAPLRHTITPQSNFPSKTPPVFFRPLDNDLNDLHAQGTNSRGSSLPRTTIATAYQNPSPSSNLVEQMPRILEFPVPHPAAPSFAQGAMPLIIDNIAASTSSAINSAPAVSSHLNSTHATARTPNFEPFIAAIKRARRSNERHVPLADVGAHLSKADYEAIGFIGLKRVVEAAVTAGAVVTGGSDYTWIGLPEWFSPSLDGYLATTELPEPTAYNRPPVRILGQPYCPHFDSFVDREISSRL